MHQRHSRRCSQLMMGTSTSNNQLAMSAHTAAINSPWAISVLATSLSWAFALLVVAAAFSSLAKDFWRMFDNSFPGCASFFFFLFLSGD